MNDPGRRASSAALLPGLMLLVAACGGGTVASPTAPAASVPPASTSGATVAPSPSAAVSYPLELTDAAGEVHRFEEPPARIGCWWLGCSEVLADLGVRPHAAGAEISGPLFFPDGTGPVVTISDGNSVEEWAAAEPDVLVGDAWGVGGDNAEAFAQVAPVFHLHTPFYDGHETETLRGIDAYAENLRIMGKLTLRTAEAEAAIARFEALLADLKEVAPAGAGDTVIALLWASNEGQYFLLEAESPFCDAIEGASLGLCIDEQGEINAEAFLGIDPDWIAYIAFGEDSWQKRPPDPVWQQLSAVEAGQVYDSNGRGNGSTRIFCCSLRGLEHALLEYAHEVWGEAAGVPDPGPAYDYDPRDSAVLTGS